MEGNSRHEWRGEGWYDLLLKGRPVVTAYYETATAMHADIMRTASEHNVSCVHVYAARRIS